MRNSNFFIGLIFDISQNASMNLKILGGDLQIESEQFRHLNNYCTSQGLFLTMEWKNGQYWLHSDDPKERPISVDIDRDLQRHELYFKSASILREVPAKAIGVKGGVRPKILDLTGGLLGDSLLFLSYGCEVLALERNPIIAFLIKSALKNASHPLLQKFSFIESEAFTFLETLPNVDIIYFDPMFEDVNEKSLPKKEMRIFRSFVGSDKDAKKVIVEAKKLTPKRLVVKRPRLSATLMDPVDVIFEGKATRYDVYLP